MKVVTADQMRQIEARSEAAGVSTDTLMENAGLAVARTLPDASSALSPESLSWYSSAPATTEPTD